MPVAEQYVGSIVMTVGWTGGVAADGFNVRRIAIRVEVRRDVLRNGRHIANPDHFGGPLHGSVFDRTLRKIAIDIAAETQLRARDGFSSVLKVNAPVVVSQALKGAVLTIDTDSAWR
jgi:hypothetical protein